MPVVDAFEMVHADAHQVGDVGLERDARLRRGNRAAGVELGDAADAGRVALRRDRHRRFAAFEKDVLRGEAAVLARADAQLRERAVARIERDSPGHDAFEFARGEAARLPVLAFVGAHRGDRELVVDHARERVAEERQLRRAGLARERRQQRARVARRQQHAERRAPRHRAAAGERRRAARQHRDDRAGRQRDQFGALHVAHDAAVGERRFRRVEVDAAARVAVRETDAHQPKVDENSTTASPISVARSPAAHSTRSVPPGTSSVTGERNPRSLIATAAHATAPVPQAAVAPAPRSQCSTRKRSPTICTKCTFVPAG